MVDFYRPGNIYVYSIHIKLTTYACDKSVQYQHKNWLMHAINTIILYVTI